MEVVARGEILKEGLVVTLGQNMFSLPKRQWFSLRTTGLFYSPRERSSLIGRRTCSESVIEFDTMYLRVEKIEDEKVVHRTATKLIVYCLRVGDKRKCRLLCFPTWEERDFWMITILTAIAKFKILNESRKELCEKVPPRCTAPVPTLRTRGKTASLRLSRFACEGKSLRRRFTSLRSRKSIRESSASGGGGGGDFNENVSFINSACRPTSDISYDAGSGSVFYKDASVSDTEREARSKPKRCSQLTETSSTLSEDCPASRSRYKPWLFEKISSTVDFGMKRHFSSVITKFT